MSYHKKSGPYPWKTLVDDYDNESYSFLVSSELSLKEVEDLLDEYTTKEIYEGLNLELYYILKDYNQCYTHNLRNLILLVSIASVLSFLLTYFLFSGFVMNYMFFYDDNVHSCYLNASSKIVNVTMTLPDKNIYRYQEYEFSKFLCCKDGIYLYQFQSIPIYNGTHSQIQNLETEINKGPNISDSHLYSSVFKLTNVQEIKNNRFFMEILATFIGWSIVVPIFMLLNMRKYNFYNGCIFFVKACMVKYKNRNSVKRRISIV